MNDPFSHIAQKCRAGIMLENARTSLLEFEGMSERDLFDSLLLLDRLAAKVRSEVAAMYGADYEQFWEKCRPIEFFQIDKQVWIENIEWDPAMWDQTHVTNFLASAAGHLGFNYQSGRFEGSRENSDAARILYYFVWLHSWLQLEKNQPLSIAAMIEEQKFRDLADPYYDPHRGEEV